MATTTTRRKRRLGNYLRKLREAEPKRTQDEAADFLEVKRPTIVRMEAGETMPKRRDVTALVAFYGGTDAQRQEALALWDEARQDTVRIALPGQLTPQLRAYLRGEAEADAQKIISTQTIHGLLQTYDYAAAILSTPSGYQVAGGELERYAGARISRQGRIRGHNRQRLHVLIDEGVVRRTVGGRDVMRAQLSHLVELSSEQNISLQVVPFSSGSYGTMSGDFYILEFADNEDPPAAYVEYAGGGRWVEENDDIAKLAVTFELAARAALSEADTVALFRQVIEELTRDD